MKLHPLGDRVVVKRQEAKDKTDSGLYLPDNAREKMQRGEVLAVGPGRRDEDGFLRAPGVAAGQVVIFGSYCGHEVEVANEKYLILSEQELLAVLA